MAKFRLQAVLKERERVEQLKQKAFAEQLQVVQTVESHIAQTQQLIVDSTQEINSAKSQGVTVAQLQFNETYRRKLHYELQLLQVKHYQEQQVLQQKQKEMVQAAQKRRVLEILKEKEEHAHKKKIQRWQQLEMDEVALNQEVLKRQNGKNEPLGL